MRPRCARLFFPLSEPLPQLRALLAHKPASARSFLTSAVARARGDAMPPVSTSIPTELPSDEPDDVLFSSLYGVRTIELNRPKKLNSLNGSMVRKILPRLREWEKSQMANIILISGAGAKAFCAGGDVAALAQQNSTEEGQQASTDYFALEFKLDHLIATYSKPYIAIMDGITMGGGVGLSVHAPFRIATEKTVFAMPETTIGYFPDVGGSFFLPRLDGEIGTYLALTSERLHGVQAFNAGIATHYMDSSVLAALTTRLSELSFKDYAPLSERLQLIDSTLAEYCSSLPSPDSYETSKYGNLTGNLRKAIDRCFHHDDIESIISALDNEAASEEPAAMKEWAAATKKTILTRSPTSLKVTLRQQRVGKEWNISETFIREHYLAAKFMAHPDFVEGVSARLLSKPPRTPKWQPAELSDVSSEAVTDLFRAPEGAEPLALITPMPGAPNPLYKEYPHAKFALPSEADILAAVKAAGRGKSKEIIVDKVAAEWNHKAGVKEKVSDVLTRRSWREMRSSPSL